MILVSSIILPFIVLPSFFFRNAESVEAKAVVVFSSLLLSDLRALCVSILPEIGFRRSLVVRASFPRVVIAAKIDRLRIGAASANLSDVGNVT